jgi:alpha-N-acetylglucosamine transferase
MHSIYYNYAPDSSNDVWQKYSECNPEINLRNTDDLYIPQPRTEAFKKSTMYSLPSIWNELSPFVKLQTKKYPLGGPLTRIASGDLVQRKEDY